MINELDFTQLSLFTFCPRKYKYIFMDELEHHVGNAAVFGSALVHPPIVAWYKHEAPDWDAYHKAFKAEAPKPMDDLYNLDRARAVYEKYIEAYASDLDEYELVCGEVAASFAVAGGRFVSKPDLVLRERATGHVGVIDIKSSKWLIGAELVPFDRQFLGQARLVNAKWMIKTHIQLLKKETRLSRSHRLVMPDLLAEWEAELDLVYKWVDACKETGVWPKQAPGSCTAFNSMCEFLDLCGMGKLREGMIAAATKVDSKAYLKAA